MWFWCIKIELIKKEEIKICFGVLWLVGDGNVLRDILLVG